MEDRGKPRFFLPIALRSLTWSAIWRGAGGAPPFPGAPAEWTTDQQRLVAIAREVDSFFEMTATLKVRVDEAWLEQHQRDFTSYRRFAALRERLAEQGGDPYQTYTHGFSVK